MRFMIILFVNRFAVTGKRAKQSWFRMSAAYLVSRALSKSFFSMSAAYLVSRCAADRVE